MNFIVFNELQNDEVILAYNNFLQAPRKTNYDDFLGKLFKTTTNFGEYLLDKIKNTPNLFLDKVLNNEKIDHSLGQALLYDLTQISSMARYPFMSQTIRPAMSNIDFVKEYQDFLSTLKTLGTGDFRKFSTFLWDGENFEGVKMTKTPKLKMLYGYEAQRRLILKNTRSFIDGKEANYILLYGDAGTGKSTTIRALSCEFFEKGVRLIEVKKTNIHTLPLLFKEIKNNPLKFIVFIDDLSFFEDDSDYIVTKNVLEGSVAGIPPNVLIYATSNRRHLIRETHRRRKEEISVSDSIQESTSLSSRFGLQIYFEKPDKDLFLQIIHFLYSTKFGQAPKLLILQEAEKYALKMGGRSPRTAVQFINSI